METIYNEEFLVFYNKYRSALEQLLGIEFKMGLNKEKDGLNFTILNIAEDVFNINKNPLKKAFNVINGTMVDFYEEYSSVEFKPLFKSLLIEECIYNLIQENVGDKRKLGDFLEDLKQVSSKTYENECTKMSFIVMKKDIDIKSYLSNIHINFIPFLGDKKSLIEVIKDKQTLKLIDGLSLSYILNTNFEIIGLAQKKSEKKSIMDIMMNRYRIEEQNDFKINSYSHFIENLQEDKTAEGKEENLIEMLVSLREGIIGKFNSEFNVKYTFSQVLNKIIEEMAKGNEEKYTVYIKAINLYNAVEKRIDIQEEEKKAEFLEEIAASMDRHQMMEHDVVDFVYINDRQIYWSLSDSNILNYKNGHWKLKNYTLLGNILSHFIIKQYARGTFNLESNLDYILKKINSLTPKVMDLFNVLKELSQKNIGSLICMLKKEKRRKATIYREMLRDGSLTTGDYDVVIKNEKGNNLNIRSCDKYLFELIASIDGAVLLDSSCNILSYGELIKVDSERKKEIQRGARTSAAISASKFGLSIKISEDGDINVFENGKVIMCI